MLPQFEKKKEMYNAFLHQDGYTVKYLAEAGKYIYNGLTKAQKEELATLYYQDIERVFKEHHRDYAEQVFRSLSPAYLGRSIDEQKYTEILTRVGDSNSHFKNLLKTEIQLIKLVILQKS